MSASDRTTGTTTGRMALKDYSNPSKICDIVMKGGITSGVVYPLAVCELAKTYKLKNVGGTSAGAIAAVTAAAAEFGRTRGGGFAELEKLPRWIGEVSSDGKNSNLFSLFQPQVETRALFNTLTAGLGESKGRIRRVVFAGIRNFPIAAAFGALPGLILVILALWSGTGLLRIWALAAALLLTVIGIILFVLYVFIKRTASAVPKNFYGLCSGYAEPSPNRPLPLTSWLTELIDRLAGISDPEKPLTFGDLWGTDDPEDQRALNLEMMTTNLTHGRPYRLPFETDIFYFHPEEFRKLFPERIVAWMEKHPRKTDDPKEHAPLCPLPAAADLPVVVGARLSLSFPLLISAVPLYAIDYSRRIAEQERKPDRCWFSDGGISSNFPVHFFDQPLPGWPTFAINLRPFHPDYPRDPDECKNIWTPETNRSGIAEWWTRFDENEGVKQLTGFFGAIINAMQNWMDNTQLRVPGYRDRIVHISLEDDEGGINVNMPSQLIEKLAARGKCAGEKLVDRFAAPPNTAQELSWDNHRWVRYRSTMALIEELLTRIHKRYNAPQPGDRTYDQLIQRKKNELPNSYRWSNNNHRDFALEATHDLLHLVGQWGKKKRSFRDGDPNPEPELRITPQV